MAADYCIYSSGPEQEGVKVKHVVMLTAEPILCMTADNCG